MEEAEMIENAGITDPGVRLDTAWLPSVGLSRAFMPESSGRMNPARQIHFRLPTALLTATGSRQHEGRRERGGRV